MPPANVHEEAGAIEQEAWVKVPESVPFWQVLVWLVHWEPKGTLADWYAAVVCPCWIAEPLKEQVLGSSMVQEAWVKVPEKVPLWHVRCWEVQVCPKGTEED